MTNGPLLCRLLTVLLHFIIPVSIILFVLNIMCKYLIKNRVKNKNKNIKEKR